MADLAAAKVAPRQLQLETERLEVWLAETVAIIQIHLMEELAKAPLLVSLANLPVNSMLVGGGGGTSFYGSAPFFAGAGGDGGGGEGAGYYDNAAAGTPNTGGGGGGGAGNTATFGVERGIGAAGGSGIVCIRLHQDDPTENVLSGTWKFNDTLTMPSALFTENFDYDGTIACAGSSLYGVMGVQELSSNKNLCFGHNPGDLSANYVQVYRFTNNTWLQATAKTIKFWNRYQVVSPEFYAWFTANATKISD